MSKYLTGNFAPYILLYTLAFGYRQLLGYAATQQGLLGQAKDDQVYIWNDILEVHLEPKFERVHRNKNDQSTSAGTREHFPAMDAGAVFSVLESACYSQVSTAQQAAMISLQEYEIVDGFATCLMQIIDSDQIPDTKLDCRLLAVITLKNVISRCWKSRGSTVHLLNANEKSYVKDFAIKRSLRKERDQRVLIQLSVLLAEVAKMEWPTDWPQLLPSLFDDVKSGEVETAFSSSISNDAITLFYSVLQELSTKTISNARNEFKNSAIFMFPYFAKKLETLSVNLLNMLPECINRESNMHTDTLSKANAVADQLTTVTNILDIFVLKVFASISATPEFACFFEFLLTQQTKLVSFLQCQSLDVLESFASLTVRYDVSLESCGVGDVLDIDKVTDAIKKNPCEVNNGMAFLLLLRISNITNKIAYLPVVLQKDYPLQMVPFLKSFLNTYHKVLSDSFPSNRIKSGRAGKLYKSVLSLTKVSCISATLFISNVLSCKVYTAVEKNSVAKLKEKLNFRFKSPPGANTDQDSTQDENSIDNATMVACEIKAEFFHPDRIFKLLQLVMNNCLQLSQGEIEEWNNDPETFYTAQEGLRESDTLKTASEGLYLGLLDSSPSTVGTTIASLLTNMQRQTAAITSSVTDHPQHEELEEEIGFWNSVYLCAGLGPAALGQYINISDWVSTAAGPLVSQLLSHPRAGALCPVPGDGQLCGPQIMRARLLWLLGIFSYQLDHTVLAQIVPVLLSVLESQDSDLVVVMTTVSSLGLILNVKGLMGSESLRAPDIVRIVSVLCVLTTKRLEEQETRGKVVEVIRDLLNSLGKSFFTDMEIFGALTYHLSSLWGCSDPTSPLRVAIIETLSSVVKLSGSLSPALHTTCLPLIQYATSGSLESSFLVREAIKLWLDLLRNLPYRTPAVPGALLYTAELNDLLRNSLVSLFSTGSLGEEESALEDLMRVMEAHAVAGGSLCLSSCSESLQLAFSRVIGQVAPRVVPYVTRPLEAFFLSNPQETSLFLLGSNLLSAIILPCCAAVPEINQTKILESYEEADIAVVSYLSILARIILSASNTLTDILEVVISSSDLSKIFRVTSESTSADKAQAQQSLFNFLIRLMIDKFDAVAYCSAGAWRRKLWALALLSLYPRADPSILGWFPEVVNIAQDVLCEEDRSILEGPQSPICGGRDVDDAPDENEGTNFSVAFESLLSADIVTCSNLRNVTGAKVQAVKEVVGEVAFNQGMMAVLGRTY